MQSKHPLNWSLVWKRTIYYRINYWLPNISNNGSCDKLSATNNWNHVLTLSFPPDVLLPKVSMSQINHFGLGTKVDAQKLKAFEIYKEKKDWYVPNRKTYKML